MDVEKMIDENQIREEENGSSYQGPPMSSYQSYPAEPEKKSSTLMILAVVAACCIGIIVFFLFLSLLPMDWTINGYEYPHRSLMDIIMN